MQFSLLPLPKNWDINQSAFGMHIFDQADESEAGLPPFLRFLDRVECHGHTAERIGHWNTGGMEQAVGHKEQILTDPLTGRTRRGPTVDGRLALSKIPNHLSLQLLTISPRYKNKHFLLLIRRSFRHKVWKGE